MHTKILLADDHSMIRKGIRLICEVNLGYSHIDEVNSCSRLMNRLRQEPYTHLVLDIVFGDGTSLEILPNIRALYPQLNILIFTMQAPALYQRRLACYRIFDYCTKDKESNEIITIIRNFLLTEAPLKKDLELDGPSNPFCLLSEREVEILHYLLQGFTNNEIAAKLNLKWNTISTVKTRIFEKTETDNMMALKELAQLHKIESVV